MATASLPRDTASYSRPIAGPAGDKVPAPRLAGAWATLVYAVGTLLLAFPALAGRFLVNANSDQYIAGYALREFGAQSLRAGHGFPMWNPYLFGGMPFVASMNGDIFYPTFLLRMMLPTDTAMTWGFIVHVFLAGCFMYLFLRRALGLGFFGALIGGLAYMMGGNVAGLVSPGHDGKLFVATLLPLVLFFLHRGVRNGRRWAWGALALALILAVLSPHPQLLQYLLLTAGAYALFLAYTPSEDGTVLPRRIAIQRLALAAGAVVVGLLGGAIQFWPLVEYTPWSPRAGGKGWDHAVSYSMPPEEVINTYLPQFSGILDHYTGRNVVHFHSEYIGAAVLVLAGLAFGAAKPYRRMVWFWTGTLVVATLWALGGFTPFYHIVYALVPGTKFFRAPSTMLYVVSFCTAVLAGIGVERVLTGGVRGRYLVAWLVGAAFIAVLASAGALTSLAGIFALPQRAELVDTNAPDLMWGAWRSLLAVAAVAGVLLALGRRKLQPRVAAWALVALVALDLWSVERHYWRFSPRAAQLYASDPVIEYLKRIPEPGRVLPLAAQSLTGQGRDPYLGRGDGRATGFMVHGIRSVVGYHGNEFGRYDLLTGWDSPDYPSRMLNPNLWRLLNVRYLYTNAPLPAGQGMRLVAGPARNVSGETTYLYTAPSDNPAAWVASIAVKAPDESVLPTLLDPRFDVRRAALFDTGAAVPAQPVPPTLPAPSDVGVRATRWAPGRISLMLDRPAPRNAALVVSENYYPGWQATVDGRPVPVGRADYVLIGVGLPTGARSVELSFSSVRYEQGKAVTLGALALAILVLVGGLLAARREAREAIAAGQTARAVASKQ
jgi:hypothetical protein